jgi:hypothetical protein
MERIRKPIDFVIRVLTARAEGLGFNATARTFNISGNTLSSWENKLGSVKKNY